MGPRTRAYGDGDPVDALWCCRETWDSESLEQQDLWAQGTETGLCVLALEHTMWVVPPPVLTPAQGKSVQDVQVLRPLHL